MRSDRTESCKGGGGEEVRLLVVLYIIYIDRDKSWPIYNVVSQGKQVKNFPVAYILSHEVIFDILFYGGIMAEGI
mgnify:CR=1 FL=1